MPKTITSITLDYDVFMEAKAKRLKLSKVFNDYLRSYLNLIDNKNTEEEYPEEEMEIDLQLSELLGRLTELKKAKGRLIKEKKEKEKKAKAKEEEGWIDEDW